MFLVKEHPDPGSKDPEEDYPKFGLLDQVCEGRQEEGGEMRGGGGVPLVPFCSVKGQISAVKHWVGAPARAQAQSVPFDQVSTADYLISCRILPILVQPTTIRNRTTPCPRVEA